MMEGLCGRVAPGLCRLALNGCIAVRTPSGYRTWDPEKKRLTNCDSFVLDIGDDFFFVVPTNRVKPGDIILAGGTPKAVTAVGDGTITAVNFADATVETLLPEHHVFMGDTYLYGRIVSIFGRAGVRGRKSSGRLMKYMMLSGMMKGRDGGAGSLLPLMLMSGKNDFLDGLFDDTDDDDTDSADEKED